MDIIEQEANYFAMCLLMPEQFVRVDITAMGGIDLTEDRQIRDLANTASPPDTCRLHKTINARSGDEPVDELGRGLRHIG